VSDLITVVEGLDFVVSLAAGHVHPEEVYEARTVAERARARAGHLGSTLVLALVGGTGSGKSSLLNAFAGEAIASTSPVRPHTTEPLAWIPADAEPSLAHLLDRIGVERRVPQTRFEHLAMLDMTDVDSVVADHRHQVERLLPELDVVLWVLDPVKYADPLLHRDFIAPLAGSSDRLVFVLNQIDRLDPPALGRVRLDLERLLHEDGIVDPRIFHTAADPERGRPSGIDELAAHLDSRLDDKRIQIGKVLDEARRVARSIAGAAGVTAGGSLEFERRWHEVRGALVTELVASPDSAGFEEALRLLESLVVRLATDAGGGFGLEIRQTFRGDRIERELREAVRLAGSGAGAADRLDEELQERFGAPIRTILWQRASLAAVVAGLSVDASAVDLGLGRIG
jgi:energy-coupling factor transporter ATP-binding protein EcfA2